MENNCLEIEEHEERVKSAVSQMPSEEKIAEMGARFKVISEPSRLKILLVLAGGELCVEHITQAVGGNQSAVSHQLKILKDNKIIKSRRSGKNVLYAVADWHILTMINVAKEHLDCNE
ncbi:MAG: metalloregulator ArsR/SmtB family transcription factor [Clostridia bacterium]|nr:metalloregulator ArsR/SmtB family transcription factor [Clostridia bacterium]